ncbi:hypothetical protein EI982_06030 [Haloplanus rallus]|uniref:Uncharacterized protein n=1 Tax=Haloplanus rallus TaxID=1816183 RepID=A0A6B9F2D5_9EURY|nr:MULTISPECIES: hypothetical protein [Haloplanus]QGX94378.1 hypothetical protein EI982_06030 [Haloplanus rallus]
MASTTVGSTAVIESSAPIVTAAAIDSEVGSRRHSARLRSDRRERPSSAGGSLESVVTGVDPKCVPGTLPGEKLLAGSPGV